MSRRYRTGTATYSEEELAIVLWRNPRAGSRPGRVRPYETFTAPDSPHPMAFPIATFTENPLARAVWDGATIARSEDAVFEAIPQSTSLRPLLVPVPIARKAFGWDRFHVPDEYSEDLA
jgi:hypothetical protein